LEGGPTDDAAIRATIDGLDRLDTEAQAADQALQQARASFAVAQAAARQVEVDSAALRSGLHRTRDPLVALGAPGFDGADLVASWTLLVDWAGREATARRQALPGAKDDDSAARAAVSAAEGALTEAVTRAGQARKSETDATGSHERAKAALTTLQTRLGELTATLIDAPSDSEAQAELARIDELAAAARDADAALSHARAARQRAEEASQALDREATAAWQVLRKTRDGLIAFGAPVLPDGPVLNAWMSLTAWAAQHARDLAGALPGARDSLLAATVERDSIASLLESDFAAAGVVLPPGELSSTAPIAAATAVNQARAERARIVERRDQAARLSTDHATADAERQVAGMLGNLLRSNQFPEWLEAAALDTLVADASLRLAELSNGQFELTHRNGEFFVVDHADADSQRGVRTLSGGETFQASLALALALSTQLSSMAAAGAARLDSIFLDEGFGTLDEATLEVVAATLENLAQGDRMVGVVTHVAALAERVPVRFVVNRDSRTSSIMRETV
jgi:exonuclease SbcC